MASQYNTPIGEERKIFFSIIPPACMVYVQRECKDVVIGFLHTYGIAWTDATEKLNNPDSDPRHPFLRLYLIMVSDKLLKPTPLPPGALP